MKLSEHYRVLKRAARFTFTVSKKYTLLLILSAFLTNIVGYIPIYFSAKVIDALIARASIETVVLYVMLTVGFVFVINFLNAYLTAEKEVANNEVWRQEDWLFSQERLGICGQIFKAGNRRIWNRCCIKVRQCVIRWKAVIRKVFLTSKNSTG